MKLRCNLREIRGTRTLREIAELSGVPQSELSKIETGLALPKDKDVAALVQAYHAAPVDWYPPFVLLAVESDDHQIGEIRERLRTTLLPAHDRCPIQTWCRLPNGHTSTCSERPLL